MSSKITKIEYITFKERLNTYRVQHALAICTKKLSEFMIPYILENTELIKLSLMVIDSKVDIQNYFTEEEEYILDSKHYSEYSLSLFNKILKAAFSPNYSNENVRQILFGLDILVNWHEGLTNDCNTVWNNEETLNNFENLKTTLETIMENFLHNQFIEPTEYARMHLTLDLIIADAQGEVNIAPSLIWHPKVPNSEWIATLD